MHSIKNPVLLRYLQNAESRLGEISSERKIDLAKVADYVRTRLSQKDKAKLIFICTHNSRRSHLSQIWAQVAAIYYSIQDIETYSGGTEATAFHRNAISALQRSGLRILAPDPLVTNPHYHVYCAEDLEPMVCFSKVYDAPPNPTQGYCAIMTCAQADDACPLVTGCDLRVPIRYEDPKIADGTERETQAYDERCAQICSEMLYLMSAL